MRIKRFEIEHVRALQAIALEAHEKATVIFGRNGCGKSSVIHALAVGLSGAGGPERDFAGSDRKNHDIEPTVLIETAAGSRWRRLGGKPGNHTRVFIDVLKVADSKRCVVVQTARPKRRPDGRGKNTGDRSLPVVIDAVERLLNDRGTPPVQWDRPNRWSDGEAKLIGLFGAIAQTLADTYQGQGELRQEGIVLIDDVDALLHPSVQQRLLPELGATFPEVQVIATTQSPTILTTVKREQIIELSYKRERKTVATYRKRQR